MPRNMTGLPEAPKGPRASHINDLVKTMNLMDPENCPISAYSHARLADIAIELLRDMDDFSHLAWSGIARCRDPRIVENLPDRAAGCQTPGKTAIHDAVQANEIDRLRQLMRIGYTFGDTSLFITAKSVAMNRTPEALAFLDEIARRWDASQLLERRFETQFVKLHPEVLSIFLRAQAETFGSNYRGYLEDLIFYGTHEMILMFWLAGFDIPAEFILSDEPSRNSVLSLLTTSHGKFRLRAELGTLEDFALNPEEKLRPIKDAFTRNHRAQGGLL